MRRALEEATKSSYKGSLLTYALVAEEVKNRWGEKELENYSAEYNMRTYANWSSIGYRVKKGEKAIRAYTFLEQKDVAGNVIKRFKRTVCLFYYKQVEKI